MADFGISEALLALSVAGAAASAYGAYSQGQAASAADRTNAQIQAQDAAIATSQAAAQANQDAQNNKRVLGQISADYAAAGVDPNSGTSLSVLSDQAGQGELQRQLALYAGKVKSAGFLDQAAIDNANAASAQSAGITTAFGTILQGGLKSYQAYKGLPSTTPAMPTNVADF